MDSGNRLTRVQNAYFLPELKIGIYEGRFDRDDGNSHQWRAFYDPQIRADNLTMAWEAGPNFVEPLRRRPEVDYGAAIPFYSLDQIEIFEFTFYYELEHDGDRPFTLSPDRTYIRHPDMALARVPTELRPFPLGPLILSIAKQVFEEFEPVGGLASDQSLSLWVSNAILGKLDGQNRAFESVDPPPRSAKIRIATRKVAA